MNPRRSVVIGAACTAWVAVATWLQITRGSGAHAMDVLWAEDAGVFINQALRHSFAENLVTPHAGYLQLIARILAQPAAHLPATGFAAWMAVSSAMVVSLVSVLVWFRSGRVVHATWARVMLALLVPLLPQAGYEVNAAVCDVHWYLAYAAFWVLITPARTTRGNVGSALVVLIAALSDPLTALVLPAALVRGKRTPRRALIAPFAMVVGLLAQIAVSLGQPSGRISPTHLGDLPWIYALRVATSGVVGDRYLDEVHRWFGLPGVAVITAGVAVVLCWLFITAPRQLKLLAGMAVTISVLYLVVALGVRGTAGFLDQEELSLNGSRYTVVPLLLLWAAVIILLDSSAQRRPRTVTAPVIRRETLFAAVVAMVLGVQLAGDWSATTARSLGPSWRADMAAARLQCAQPPAQRPPQPAVLVGDHVGTSLVPIIPGLGDITIVSAPKPPPGEPVLFGVVLPCDQIRGASILGSAPAVRVSPIER